MLLVWILLIIPVDDIPRPKLIKKERDFPLLLIIAGVIGGVLAFGILDLFVGLAMLYAVDGMD